MFHFPVGGGVNTTSTPHSHSRPPIAISQSLSQSLFWGPRCPQYPRCPRYPQTHRNVHCRDPFEQARISPLLYTIRHSPDLCKRSAFVVSAASSRHQHSTQHHTLSSTPVASMMVGVGYRNSPLDKFLWGDADGPIVPIPEAKKSFGCSTTPLQRSTMA